MHQGVSNIHSPLHEFTSIQTTAEEEETEN